MTWGLLRRRRSWGLLLLPITSAASDRLGVRRIYGFETILHKALNDGSSVLSRSLGRSMIDAFLSRKIPAQPCLSSVLSYTILYLFSA